MESLFPLRSPPAINPVPTSIDVKPDVIEPLSKAPTVTKLLIVVTLGCDAVASVPYKFVPLILPLTSSLCPGADLPIPILPFEVNVIFSLLLTLKLIDCPFVQFKNVFPVLLCNKA